MDTPTLTEESAMRIVTDVVSILVKKNADYGVASFDLGLNGNMVHLWDKIRRYRSLVEKLNAGSTGPNFESMRTR